MLDKIGLSGPPCKFGCRGRRRGAHVRDEIGDGEIGFVADSGDDGNFRIEDGARDDLFVNDQRSSMEPPPRARIKTSTIFL